MPTKSIPIPLPAATVILGRNRIESYEFFMVVRHKRSSFAPGALVFPGGKVSLDDQNESLRQYCQGTDDLDAEAFAIYVAAIRETFEESGLLLARNQNSSDIISSDKLTVLQPYRNLLNSEEISMIEFLEKEKLFLACDQLVAFAHWIAPEFAPKRFDTHFFLAKAPIDQVGMHDGSESVDSVWISPQEVLDGCDIKKFSIMPPTKINITKLGRYKTIDEAITVAEKTEIYTVCPKLEQRESGPVLCIPEEAGYGITEILLSDIPAPSHNPIIP